MVTCSFSSQTSVDFHRKDELDNAAMRHGKLTRIGAIDYGDGDGWAARLRRQVRNPSLLTFLVMAVIALAIPVGIAAPGFYSGAKEGVWRIRQDPVVHFLEVATPSYVYPYLQRNIVQMKASQTQYEWRRTSFKLGPCHQGNLAQFPEGKYTDGIAAACEELHEIQFGYADTCISDASCNIPPAAIARLDAVSTRLQETFSDAYTTRHTETVGTGE